MRNHIICNDVIAALKTLPAKIAQTVITSPPYFSMRKYMGKQNVIWDGDPNCNHEFATQTTTHDNLRFRGENSDVGNDNNRERFTDEDVEMAFCAKCGAWKGALGLEPNPEMYVDHLTQIFREVKRVLRDDGTLWINIGDCYWGSGMAGQGEHYHKHKNLDARNSLHMPEHNTNKGQHPYLKNKDLAGMPWRLAFALQSDGWWLRNEIIWSKINPAPEAAQDRFARSHEYIFLLTKQPKYYFDMDAVREPHIRLWNESIGGNLTSGTHKLCGKYVDQQRKIPLPNPAGRSKRTVWNCNTNKSNWEFCQNCDTMFIGKERKAIKTFYDENNNRILTCTCGCPDNWFSHFASYPVDLITPCILAGSPPKTCAKCGTPYKRQTEVTYKNDTTKNGKSPQNNRRQTKNPNQKDDKVFGYEQRTRRIVKNLGFHPQCQCNAGIAKAIVLDPFLGSGTTAIAAANNSRDYIGIDISEVYVKIAKERIKKETVQLIFDF